MPELSISLLGTPEIRANDRPVVIERRINRGLLIFLASQSRDVARSDLLRWFWPDHSEEIARARLSETLSRLSKALPGCLQVSTELVGLNYTRVEVDQLRFEALVNQAGLNTWRLPLDEPLPASRQQILQTATGLWRGSHYLEGDLLRPFLHKSPDISHILNQAGQQLETNYLKILLSLAENARMQGNPDGCLDYLRQALRADHTGENLNGILLHHLLEMHLWTELRAHLEHLELLYKRQSLPFSENLQKFQATLEEHLRRPPAPEPEPAWNLRHNLLTPFVGRSASLSELQQAYFKGGGALVMGESGQGKTRLVQEFYQRSRPRPRLLLASCRAGEDALPFQPWIDLLRSHLGPEDWSAIPTIWISGLSALLPELVDQVPPDLRQQMALDPGIPAEAARARLMEAIRQVLVYIAGERRLLLCLDDVQWADEASLAVTAYLLERPPFTHGLLVLVSRLEDQGRPMMQYLTRLRADRRLRTIRLPYLSHLEIDQLVNLVTGRPPSKELVDRLADETGGNPLYLVEILRHLQDSAQSLQEVHLLEIPVAPSLKSLISTRLQSLNPFELGTLQAAAVIGFEFCPSMVASASQRPMAEIVHTVETLENLWITETVSAVSGEICYRFIHSSMREVLLEEIRPLRRQWLERQVAITLECTETGVADSQAAVLAQHFEAGGEGARAFEYWMRAGQHARQLFSLSQAQEAFARAEALIPLVSGLQEGRIYDLYTEWAEMLYESEDAQTIENLSERLRHTGSVLGSSLLQGTYYLLRCLSSQILNQYETGLELAQRATQLLSGTTHSAAQMEAHIHTGVFNYMLNRLEPAIAPLEAALKLGENASSRSELRARASAHYQEAFIKTLLGWPQAALPHALHSLDDYILLKRSYGQVMAYSVLTFALYSLGEYDRAREYSKVGLEIALRTKAERVLGYLRSYRAFIELVVGNLDEALVNAQEAIEIGQRLQHNDITALGYRAIGDALSFLYAHQEAASYYEKALQVSGGGFFYLDSVYRLGLQYFFLGKTEEGAGMIQQGIAMAEAGGVAVHWLMALSCNLVVLVSQNQRQKALSIGSLLQSQGRERGLPIFRLYGDLFLGQVALENGEVEQAASILSSASEEAERLSMAWVVIPAWRSLYRALQLLEQPGESIRPRLEAYLDRIETQVQSPLLRKSFTTYKSVKSLYQLTG